MMRPDFLTGETTGQVTDIWSTRSVLPGGTDGGGIVYTFYGGTRHTQMAAERDALNARPAHKETT